MGWFKQDSCEFVHFVVGVMCVEIHQLREELHQVNADTKLSDCTNRFAHRTGRADKH